MRNITLRKRVLVMAVAATLMASVVGGTVAWAKVGDNATDANQEVELTVGDSWTVTLESNPTTGFQWQLVSNTDEAVLELADHKYEPSEDALAGVCGAGGKEVRTFKALKKGKSTITLEYSQPWEGGTKAAETFVMTVVVS